MRLRACLLLLIGLLVSDVTAKRNPWDPYFTSPGQLTEEDAYILTQADRWAILSVHNTWRREPNARDMRLMQWHCGMEQFAMNYNRQRCATWGQRAHSTGECRKNFSMTGFTGYVGENLWGGGATLMKNKSIPITAFWNEKRYWNFGNLTCMPGEVCGHYTQMVWAESWALGCAIMSCVPFGRKHAVMGCVYGVGQGNWKPYIPITDPMNGSCSACKDAGGILWSKHCIDGLCNDTPEPHPIPVCNPVFQAWSAGGDPHGGLPVCALPDKGVVFPSGTAATTITPAAPLVYLSTASLVLLNDLTGCMGWM